MEQAFNSVRTIFAFSLQETFASEYYIGLRKVCGIDQKRSWVVGLMRGVFDCLIFLIFALSFWVSYTYVSTAQLAAPDAVRVILTMMIRNILIIL